MSKIQSKEETLRSFALYGTVVGAGTLFLPIQLGPAGVTILSITTLVVWPFTYWLYKALSRFILSANIASGTGITGAVNHYYGKKIGNPIINLYLLAFFVAVFIYAMAIIDSLAEQVAHHTSVTPTLRTLLSLGVVLVLNLIFLMGRQATIKVMGFLVFPLTACSLLLFLYLVRDWHPEHLTSQMQFSTHAFHQIRISIPVIVFAFSHMSIISAFAIDQQEKHGDLVVGKYKKIMEVAYTIICASVPFFAFSCLLVIPATCIESARDQGVTILSAPSMVSDAPGWLAVTGITAVMVAMLKPFLGTYFGVIEGANEIVKSPLELAGVCKSRAFNRAMSILLASVFTFAVCFINSNAISVIYIISGPLIAMILFIMFTLPTWLIPVPKPYRSVGNAITLVVGLLCIPVIFLG